MDYFLYFILGTDTLCSARYKIVSEKRALDSAELSETMLDDKTEDQSLASCLRVYDVEKLDDDVEIVSKVS